jgi:hypothetical protein
VALRPPRELLGLRPVPCLQPLRRGVWVVLACLVLARHLRHRHSRLEWAYAVAFFTFGLTDFYEAYTLTSWLIWLKLANLILLAWLRATVIRTFYPQSKLW